MKRFSPIINERIREIASENGIKIDDIYTIEDSYLTVDLNENGIRMDFINYVNKYLEQWELCIISIESHDDTLCIIIM